ncbi:MAG: RagB/SusD family nutrient uptake outer membrane protein [Bacteroidales bacterium]|nr:RagB/SusD family nutrient uptake outer membrane protein [Bacteroidales bacterium]
MKKHKYIIAAAGVALAMSVAVSSCDYLDIEPEMKVPEEQVDFTNTSEMYQAVSGVYAIVRTAGCHWPVNLVTVIRDGDVWSGRYDDQAEMVTVGCNYVYNNSHWAFNDIWVNHYTIIRIATEALKSLDEYAKYITNEADMKKYLSYCAEVRTIRAWAYYRLVQTFGDVTILRDPDQTDLQRSDKRLVYQYMLEGDLDYAWKYGEKLRPNEMEHIGAYTAYTARMIAAKVYLELGDYAKVEECTNDIITSRKFSLYPDFYQLFKIPGKLCDEKLMEVQCTDFGMGSGDIVDTGHFFILGGPGITSITDGRKINGWGFVGYTDKFLNWMKARGEKVRATTSVIYGGQMTPSYDFVDNAANSNNTNNWNGKWYVPMSQITPGRYQYGCANNVCVLRYAEVLLMNSEALVRQGKDGDAPFNLVRTRAEMNPITGVTLQDIIDERRMELCCEWGTRYADLLRYGLAEEFLGPNGWNPSRAYYPVPAEQLNESPELELPPLTH